MVCYLGRCTTERVAIVCSRYVSYDGCVGLREGGQLVTWLGAEITRSNEMVVPTFDSCVHEMNVDRGHIDVYPGTESCGMTNG
jgi:hypothetical protein